MGSTKPWGAMKAYLDAGKPNTRLLGSVERHLLTREPEDRSTTVLHPSEIIKPDWCHRASWYLLNGAPAKTERPNLRLQNIFDEGHAIHAKWQARFQAMGNLYGWWMCDECANEHWGLSTDNCSLCGQESPTGEYLEVPLASDQRYGIEGRADGWIKGVGADCLIEIKSIGTGTIRVENPGLLSAAGGDLEEAWRSIRRPFRSHLLQGNMYLELGRQMAERGWFTDFPDEIVFLYELKANQAVKEFTVKAERSLVEPILDAAELIVAAKSAPGCNVFLGRCAKCKPFA